MIEELFVDFVGPNPILQGLVAGVVIAGFNFLGAATVLVWRNPTEKWLDAALGFAAGVMLSASFTSLLLPGIEFASAPGYDAVRLGGLAFTGVVPVLVGFGDEFIPETHSRGYERVATHGLLIGAAVMLTLDVLLV